MGERERGRCMHAHAGSIMVISMESEQANLILFHSLSHL